MTGLTIKRTATISVNLTAEQWELYTVSMPCNDVAIAINRALEAAVNSGVFSRAEVEKQVLAVMREYADYGACDSEPRWRLEQLLDKVFG